MKILLIDNGTIHINELKRLIQNHQTTIVHKEDLELESTKYFDLIILSGSSDTPIVKNPDIYKKEIILIKTTEVPLIGICMGFEVIAFTFESKLLELNNKESGLVEIIVTANDPIFENRKHFKVAENHRWVVTKIKEPLEELAISKDGIEAIRHKNKLIYGFQFHPEIFDENNHGAIIFNNSLEQIISKTNEFSTTKH